jgi:S-DNA-T family DNA segregation ATPase FtsK/SpoIIIE
MVSEHELLNEIAKHTQVLAQSVTDAEFWHKEVLENGIQQRLSEIEALRKKGIAEIEAEHKRSLTIAAQTYDQFLRQVKSGISALESRYGPAKLSWEAPEWHAFSPSKDADVPRLTRIGRLIVKEQYDRLVMSALLPIIGKGNVLIKASGPGKSLAREAMQSIMLRLLAFLPPGKLRFVCIDPVALGATMAGFVKELPDLLTGGQAWYETNHIEQRLADLEAHSAMVKQKYLGARYTTMEEYNTQAGEVAEPYRLLVVSDFPARFSDSAAQRLVSIATNGPGTGVYVLAMVDTEQKMPYNFNLADLERTATIISCINERAIWLDPDFKECALELDRPPVIDLFERIVKATGEAAVLASEVKVAFERFALPREKWWQGDACSGARIAIGRIGARDTQHFKLDDELLSSALVVGRTGSGKSTLLHTLIVNLCIFYSPDELELYLLDMKQVEFKDYATYQLPHARVVAINSEREFGLSVLRGLKAELKRRSDLLRDMGFQLMSEYRSKTGQRMPRIFLIVDEFQELFREDDMVAAQAAQILDQLVRMGRAFGINVLLASQTLAGQYTLSRSTKDQIPIRIALQCAEADSRLILSDENDQARLLERPGEAIYNAANGRIEGNSLFQVFWLDDDRREDYLCQIREQAELFNWTRFEPQVVFDGNAPAKVETNRDFMRLLSIPDWPGSQRAYLAWLGEPIEIKPHTAALLRRQSGSNIMIVGQNEHETTAMSMLTVALLSLAAQQRPEAAQFVFLNLSDVDAEWHALPDALADSLPHTIKIVPRRGLMTAIEEVTAELAIRLAVEAETHRPSIYLTIFGLHRSRDLRWDDSWYAGSDRLIPPAARLLAICREGPDVGIHTLLWCDTYANLERALDRSPERFFDLRVALQMKADDSRRLLDSDAASKLGLHRAIYCDEERPGRLEKFRPYRLPSIELVEQWGRKIKDKKANER